MPQVRSIDDLAVVAEAIERQAIDRYRTMAMQSARRGNEGAARTFLQLSSEAQAQVAALHQTAERAGHSSDIDELRDSVPPDFAASWEEDRESALLTPYRVLATAVANEQRAFVFYSYLAAEASDPKVAQEAERLALLKLGHADRLRRWRRAAYRKEPPARSGREAADRGLLADWLPQAEREIAVRHRAIGDILTRAGDEESAALLRTGSIAPLDGLPATGTPADLDLSDTDSIHLLMQAQKPLERLVEALEAALDRGPEERVYRQGQEHLEKAVLRLAAIKKRVAELVRAEGARVMPADAETAVSAQASTTRATWPAPRI